MAKKSRAEIKEEISATKEELKIAKSEKRDFEKSHKLAKDTDHSGDEKLGKKWGKFQVMVEKKQKALDALQESFTASKPEKTARVSQYDYPLVDGKEMTAGEKKKFRATSRAAAKKADKAVAKGEGKASTKKTDKAEPAVEGKKKGKKNKAAKAEPEDEDED